MTEWIDQVVERVTHLLREGEVGYWMDEEALSAVERAIRQTLTDSPISRDPDETTNPNP